MHTYIKLMYRTKLLTAILNLNNFCTQLLSMTQECGIASTQNQISKVKGHTSQITKFRVYAITPYCNVGSR